MSLSRRTLLAGLPLAGLAACADPTTPASVPFVTPTPAPAPPPPAETAPTVTGPSVARVRIDSWQAGFIGQANWGRGTLFFRGRQHAFRVRGLGMGGMGVARTRGEGEVYDMAQLSQFPGFYTQVRSGIVVPGRQITGGVWMQNGAGVRIWLRPDRTGAALQLGADQVQIELV